MERTGRNRRNVWTALNAAALLPLLPLLAACTLIFDGDGISHTLTLTSEPALDGSLFIVPPASSGWSPAGTPVFIGDDVSNNEYDALVSFILGALPGGVRIEAATLRMRQNMTLIGAPYALLGGVLVDWISYSPPASGTVPQVLVRDEVGLLAAGFIPGARHDLDVTAALSDELRFHDTGRLQFRLYHQASTTGNFSTDMDGWDMGENPRFAPQLIIIYR